MAGEMLTIGAFARACGLSPKALRLYDELDLLRPARVDPDTGYRYYTAGQLERARLVAWLRRLGMPLAQIRRVCALGADAAAVEVRAYWARVEADTVVRRDLAAFLVDHLTDVSRRDTTMSTGTLELRYHAHSDRGRVRTANQDAAYAGRRLLAVADGFGPAGGPAAGAAVAALRRLETREVPAGGVLNLLEDAVRGAARAVRDVAAGAEEAGTTLTAALWTGSRLALVHIGDSRAYLLRGGELFRVTHDHTVVQSLVDEGRLTEEEAASHPQRTLLLKALTGAEATAAPDLRLHDVRAGDRWLLCSDGLPRAVPDADVRRLLVASAGPAEAVGALIGAADEAGGPDNVACAVAYVVDAADAADAAA
ncbi:MerR family transcriptional regulator [Streptomyces calvus]|uniref:Protein phosphatase n=1 Tax=Streptomyces calvus TaxID=67282 RepID=A0AA40SAA1_9ACTN|nr:MerR family transcriptional regulator [Streptomyces calvus]MBA8942836.1 protein phosphatase [Streptomyces calvus]GGP33626.1 hypothetical protein GCM10010247_00990 [Streptomyces calvus]